MNCSERISEKAGEQKINMEKKKGCVSKTSGHILLWGLLMPISRRFKLSIVMWQNRHIAETTQEAGFLLASTMHGGTSIWAGEDPGKCQPWARGRGVHCANGCALGPPPSWVYPPPQAKMMRRGTSSCLTVHKDSGRHSTTCRAPGVHLAALHGGCPVSVKTQ